MSTGGDPAGRSPQLSPDGKWIWDGKQWLPVTAPSPQPRPPQISPDGRWVWDGRQWLPVARKEAVFPAFSVVVAEAEPAPEPEPEVAKPLPIPVIGDEPEPDPYAYSYAPAAESATPAWERPQTGLNRYLYVAAGVVVLLIAAIWLGSLGQIQFPWEQTNSVAPRPSPTPPITARTESAGADRFLTGFLDPSMSNLTEAEAIVGEVCNGQLTFSCRDDMIDADSKISDVIATIDQQQAPACIAGIVAKMRGDLVNMDKGIQTALQGYNDNKPSELVQGLAVYRNAVHTFGVDRASAAAIQQVACSTEITAP